MAEETEHKPSSCVLRLRGLPFQSTEDDIKEFFSGFELVEAHICRRNGRATGEAYVQLASEESADEALKELNKKHMGRRYIEIFEAFDSDLAAVKSMKDNHQVRGFVLRLRGLPYSASAADVEKFFEGIPLKKGQEGVVFTFTPEGRRTGEAYVEFESEELQREALKRHRESMGTRYIEIFISSKPDMYQAMSRYIASDLRRRWVASPLAGLPDASARARATPYGVEQVTDLFRGFALGPRVPGIPGRPDLMNSPGQGRPDGLPGTGLASSMLQPVGPRKTVVNQEYATSDGCGPSGNNFGGQHMLLPQDYSVQQQQQQQQLLMQQQYLMQLQGQAMRYEPWGSMGVFGGLPPQGSAMVGSNWYKQYGTAAGAGGLGMAAPYHLQPVPGFGMAPMMTPEHTSGLGVSDMRVVQHGEAPLSSNKDSAADGASLEQGTPTHRSF